MSGGSMDYLYYKVRDVAGELKLKTNTPLQRAFGEHLEKVADALHDVEWVWSGDYGKGDDEEAIKKVLGDAAIEKEIGVLISDARKLIEDLEKHIR